MPPTPDNAFIHIEGLRKSFGDHLVIENFSLAVRTGGVVVLQGPSGVGKSTLSRCLTYLEPFQAGRIRVDELELRAGMDERHHRRLIRDLRTRLGLVFQFFHLFPHLSVLENLTLGPVKVLGVGEEEARARGLELLKRVGLENKAGARPLSLSGGQQQRVGIARALAMRPEAILFDEPTSSLDPEMKEEIIRVMEDFAGDGQTMIIVTHEPAFLERIATRIIKLGPGGTILSDQPHTPAKSLSQ